MLINRLELLTLSLQTQYEYHRYVLELPSQIHADRVTIQAGRTEIIFNQAPENWAGQYHFCFNIPENQFANSKQWISAKTSLLKDENGKDEFQSNSWNSTSLYFKDPAGNILEFIARHDQKNAVNQPFHSKQILQVSEIGLPSRDVISLANELCQKLGISLYKQEANATFIPIGDEDGLFILPVENRIWYPNTGVPAKLLDVKINCEINGKSFNLNGMPYVVTTP